MIITRSFVLLVMGTLSLANYIRQPNPHQRQFDLNRSYGPTFRALGKMRSPPPKMSTKNAGGYSQAAVDSGSNGLEVARLMWNI